METPAESYTQIFERQDFGFLLCLLQSFRDSLMLMIHRVKDLIFLLLNKCLSIFLLQWEKYSAMPAKHKPNPLSTVVCTKVLSPHQVSSQWSKVCFGCFGPKMTFLHWLHFGGIFSNLSKNQGQLFNLSCVIFKCWRRCMQSAKQSTKETFIFKCQLERING